MFQCSEIFLSIIYFINNRPKTKIILKYRTSEHQNSRTDAYVQYILTCILNAIIQKFNLSTSVILPIIISFEQSGFFEE